MNLIRFMSLLLLISLVNDARCDSINIAVASNFVKPMREIVLAFEKITHHRIKLSIGSSGKFYAQIKNGAPYHLFFSADQNKPIALENDKLAVKGSRFTYAIGALALWTTKPNFIDNGKVIFNLESYNKLAIANPKLAPYGIAAVQVLKSLKLIDKTQPKWVQGENISQTYQFVGTGNVDLGFVSLSQVMKKGIIVNGFAWIVPKTYYNPIKQDVVLLLKGEGNPLANQFLRFMQSRKSAAIILAYGYSSIANESSK